MSDQRKTCGWFNGPDALDNVRKRLETLSLTDSKKAEDNGIAGRDRGRSGCCPLVREIKNLEVPCRLWVDRVQVIEDGFSQGDVAESRRLRQREDGRKSAETGEWLLAHGFEGGEHIMEHRQDLERRTPPHQKHFQGEQAQLGCRGEKEKVRVLLPADVKDLPQSAEFKRKPLPVRAQTWRDRDRFPTDSCGLSSIDHGEIRAHPIAVLLFRSKCQ